MKRALLVRAGFENELVDAFLRTSAVHVGWERLGDLAGMKSDRVDAALLREYPECRTVGGAPCKHYREITDFALVAQPGDTVVTPDRAGRRFLVGTVSGPYHFNRASRLWSGGEPYMQSLPVSWTHAVSRDDVAKSALTDTDQRGKTTFWLKPATLEEIAKAPRIALG